MNNKSNNQTILKKSLNCYEHEIKENILILSKDFSIHQQIKTLISPTQYGTIHITDTKVSLSILQEQPIHHLIWDSNHHDIQDIVELSSNNISFPKIYIISNTPQPLLHYDLNTFLSIYTVHPNEINKILPLLQEQYTIKEECNHNVFNNTVLDNQELYDRVNRVLIGESHVIKKIQNTILQLKNSDINVLIRGESGTGKGIVSRLIHSLSNRSKIGDFVTINCPSIPESLFESEIFGHEAGAYTGATNQKPGRLEMGNHGTVFFDEIGEIPPSIQAKLLEFLETKQIIRVGSTKPITLEARIVSATNAPLESLMKKKMFRQDLFYRLNEYAIHLPPLRERVSDIPVLVNHFLREFTNDEQTVHPLSNETLQMMLEYSWPGNVRELRSMIKTYAFTLDESLIQNAINNAQTTHDQEDSNERWEKIEAQTILATLNETRWNQKKAASLLGISYSTIRRKIKKFKLTG